MWAYFCSPIHLSYVLVFGCKYVGVLSVFVAESVSVRLFSGLDRYVTKPCIGILECVFLVGVFPGKHVRLMHVRLLQR